MVLFSPRWKHSRRIEYIGCDEAIYQQDLVVHRTAGRDYEEVSGGLKVWHIYLGPRCRADYGDLRFTDRSGRELAYYLWPDYTSESARVCVRLEGATSAGALTIHYGNPAATATSDPTVEFHDLLANPSFEVAGSWAYSEVTAGSGDGTNGTLPSSDWASHGAKSAYIYCGYGSTYSSGHYYAKYSQTVQLPAGPYLLVFDRNGSQITADRGYMAVMVDGVQKYYSRTQGVQLSQQTDPFTATGSGTVIDLRNGVDTSGGVRYASGYWDNLRIRIYSATPPSLLRSTRGIIAPPVEAISGYVVPIDFDIVYDIEIGSTGQNLSLLYHLLRSRDLATLYGIHQHQALDTIYQIEVLKDLLTSYHILIKQEAVIPYDIPGGVTFQLVYSVLAEAVLDYRINVGAQVYDPERFWDLVITRKLNQLHTATFELWTEGADVSGVREGATIRIFYNDEVRFSGEIRSIRKDDMSGIWSVECESGACRLADDAVQGVLDYKATPGDAILRAVLPSPAWEGEIDPAPAIDYRQEYADVLTHVTNLASVLGYDWRVREVEDRYQVTGRTEITITVTGAGWPASSLVGRVVVVTSGTAKFRAGVVTSHTADTLTFAGTAWTTSGLEPGDAIRVFGPFRLDCKKRIGATVPRKTFAVNREIFDSSTSRDVERVANAIVVPGTASITQDRNSVISGNTLLVTPITVTEAVLRLNLSSAATTVPVDSTASFPSSGTIQIENERIAYTEKTATSFTGCTRGYGGSSPAAHNLQTEVVLVSSLPVDSTVGFPASGTVWVGIEKIAYTAKAATAFLNLTRGVDGTEIYAHRAGVLARCGSYTDESPEPGSSVALYGVRRRVVPALGVLDQNTLDLLAQERLLALQDLKVWGSGIVIDSAFLEDIDVGDEIAIAPEDDGDAESYRLVGVVWRQMTGEIEIEYGAVREYFLEDLSRLQKGVDLANARGAVAMLGTVLSVSSNGEVAQVLLDDGTTVWARIR